MARQIEHVERMSESSSGGRLVATDGRSLPLRGVTVRADARAGVARVVLEQRFFNPYDEPLRVTYLVPLPVDGAVSGYAFQLGAQRIVGEVDKKRAARERFERAIVEGRSAALLVQERSSLFTQEIGNVPPKTEIVAELSIDQRLAWLDEGAWEWRFPTVVAPRYHGASGRVADAERVTVDVGDRPPGIGVELALRVRDALPAGTRPESPSHTLHLSPDAAEGTAVSLETATSPSPLDRDLVVRWRVAEPKVTLSLDVGRPAEERPHAGAAYGLVTLVPPRTNVRTRAIARDLIVLLDTSGSMEGAPLDQARRVVGALVDTLSDEDQLELIEFGSTPRRWKSQPVRATATSRQEAQEWLRCLRASGGTEMKDGILEALRPLRADAQRQIVLVTDGLIGFEEELLAALSAQLPSGSRLHTVGVGSAVNRSLTAPAARAGRGLEVVIGLGEDPERAARRLVARTTAPLVVDMVLEGSALLEHAPARLPDLFAGAPVLIAVKLRPEGGRLTVRGRTAEGRLIEELEVAPVVAGAGSPAVVALFGREAVEDRELARCAGGATSDHASFDAEVERLGLSFQISTRLTSWVAVSSGPTIDPQAPTRTERVPHALPHGMSVAGLGLRPAAPASYGALSRSAVGGATAPAEAFFQAEDDEHMDGAQKEEGDSEGSALTSSAKRKQVREEPATAPRPSMPDRARNLLRGASAKGAPPSPPASPSPPKVPSPRQGASTPPMPPKAMPPSRPGPSSSQGARARRLSVRIVLSQKGELIVEVTLDGPLDWRAPKEAELRIGGRVVRVEVDAARSTRAGSLATGQVVRLAFSLPPDEAEVAAPFTIELETPDGPLVLTTSR